MSTFYRKQPDVLCLQGGKSRELSGLFCTSIRTEPVRKSVTIFLKMNEFSCGFVQIHVPRHFALQIDNIKSINCAL